MELYGNSPQESGTDPTTSNKGKKILLFSVIPISSLVILISIFSFFSKPKAPEVQGTSAIRPRSIYENPFDKKVQYINPFAPYKNPLNNIK